jgi:hypothetical protein
VVRVGVSQFSILPVTLLRYFNNKSPPNNGSFRNDCLGVRRVHLHQRGLHAPRLPNVHDGAPGPLCHRGWRNWCGNGEDDECESSRAGSHCGFGRRCACPCRGSYACSISHGHSPQQLRVCQRKPATLKPGKGTLARPQKLRSGSGSPPASSYPQQTESGASHLQDRTCGAEQHYPFVRRGAIGLFLHDCKALSSFQRL